MRVKRWMRRKLLAQYWHTEQKCGEDQLLLPVRRKGALHPQSDQMWAPKDIMHIGAVLGSGTKSGDVKLAQFSLLW